MEVEEQFNYQFLYTQQLAVNKTLQEKIDKLQKELEETYLLVAELQELNTGPADD